jgi:hypothetical protein
MKRQLVDPKKLYRFNRESNTFYIDIHINYYREIYNEWDFSPLVKRDLDDELFEHLETCAGEIPKNHNLSVVFHLPAEIKDPEKEGKSITGFRNYFKYQIRKLNQKRQGITNRIGIYGILGCCLIASGYLFKRVIPEENILIILIEGLFIGGWVLFWELFSIVFFKLNDIRKRRFFPHRLETSELEYEYIEP